MVLNGKEIKEGNFIRRAKDDNFTAASYNLSIGKIVTMDGKSHDEYVIPPRGMVLLVSEEIFQMPTTIIGFTTIKNSLSVKGLLAINIGIVDPKWNKPISSAIINFGSEKQFVQKGDCFLRMTFQQIKAYDRKDLLDINNQSIENENEVIFKDYLTERKKIAVSSLSETFLSINEIKEEITWKVLGRFIKTIGYVAAGLAIIAFIANYTVNVVNSSKKANDNHFNSVTDSLSNRIDSLEKTIYKLHIIEKSKNGKEIN